MIKKAILKVLMVLVGFTISNAQEIKFPDSFVLGKQEFLKDQIFVSPKLFSQQGISIKNNPGITGDKAIIAQFFEDFNPKDITRLYLEVYADKKNPAAESIAVTVLDFDNLDKLKENMKIVNKIGLFTPVYFVVNKYVIALHGSDRYLIDKISNYYSKKLGAEYYFPNK